MEDNDKIKQRFELLKMARELLNEDYINKRAQDHNKWVAENEESWRTTRRNVPYPPFAQYPTDDEIVRAASNLYNFIYLDSEKEEIEVKTSVVKPSPIPEGDFVFPRSSTPTPTEVVKTESVPKPVEIVTAEILPEKSQVNEEKSYTYQDIKNLNAEVANTKSLLPGWMRRTKQS